MKTVFPKKPARDFNEWMSYIRSEIHETKKVEPEPEEEIKYYQAHYGDMRSGSPTGTPITG